MNKCKGFSKMWFMVLLLVSFMAGCAENGGDPGTLVSIKVTPATASIPVTGTQQYTALAVYGDGSARDVTASATWSPGTAGVTMLTTPGLATGVTANVVPVVITATFGGKSGSANLTVNAAISVSFNVTPVLASIPVTGTQQYTAIESFSDGSTIDRTENPLTTWASVDVVGVGVASLSPSGVGAGVATGNVIGQSDITATFNLNTTPAARLTVTSATVVSIMVTPATATIPVNGKQQFKAFAILSAGPPLDVTANPLTTWASVDVLVASLSPSGVGAGVATGLTVGQSDITATFSGITNVPAASLTVFAPGSSQLGSAAAFGIMATAAVTNTGPSIINGDVSLDPGTSMTGFPPGVVNGTIHVNDGVSTQARLDLLAAYNFYTNLPPGTTVSAGADLGALNPGGVLPPGTYTSGSTMLVSTPVTLNGTATDVWVFQIGSSLTTSANVILGPGVLANNVFWVPALDATIGVGSTFSGTIVAGRDVTAVTGATINGRILAGATTAGTIALQTTIVNVPAP